MDDQTKPDEATRDAERREAEAAHESDREPTADEEAVADGLEVDPETAKKYKEMAERGAEQKGEGRLP